MEEKVKGDLDFYYGKEAELFNFYRVPKLLFTDDRFLNVSIEAKVLYGLLLDRMSLSMRNEWIDEQNRVYIYFTVKEAMDFLRIGKEKCIKLFSELDSEKGCGLIRRKRQGLGKPSVIYVMNFNTKSIDSDGTYNSNKREETITGCDKAVVLQRSENQTSSGSDSTDLKKSENRTSERSEKPTSESTDIGIPEARKTDSNNTDKNYIDFNNTDVSDTNPIQSYQAGDIYPNDDVMDEMENRTRYKQLICENIEADFLKRNYDDDMVDGIVDIMLDAVCSKKRHLTVSGEDKPQEVVKSRLLKLDYSHVEYVLDCLKKNTTKVRNIKSYLLAALYNSVSTIGHYYTSEVNHDMYAN